MAVQIPRKKTVFLVRLMVIITTAYFILLSPVVGKDLEVYGYLFIAVYLLTNLIVAYIPEKYFHDDRVFYGFILCDSILRNDRVAQRGEFDSPTADRRFCPSRGRKTGNHRCPTRERRE